MRVLLVAVVLVAAGCLGPAVEDRDQQQDGTLGMAGLDARGAAAVEDEEGRRTFHFEGEAPAGARLPEQPDPLSRPLHAFEADARVAFISIELVHEGPGTLDAVLRDPWGRIQCAALAESVDLASDPPERRCTAPVPGNLTSERAWTVDVGGGAPAAPPGVPYRLAVTLHPPWDLDVTDPLTGSDAAIRFRVVDTGAVDGFEPSVGVLADGTIFTQMSLETLRSRDGGRTWADATPDPPPPTTADPMMAVDPWSGRVYVNHLTIACSILWWSDDAGRSWSTNPAACGLPVNDHQKVAVGPSALPGAASPVVYYGWYSFDGFVWVARSLDGGHAFTTAPVFTPADGDPVNIGPIEADREGGVFVPTYFCDDGGWVGVGVSHDRGATFRTVRVTDEDGPCDQVDPSVTVDAAGNAYLAFVRPTGVKVAVSEDRGLTWGEPFTVSLPHQTSFLHVAAVAGDEGALAVAYRATADGDGGPSGVDGWAAWHLSVTFVEDAGSAAPRTRSAVVGGGDAPVHRGPHCLGFYPPCPPGERVIGEFFDAALMPDGRLVLAYDTGCRGPCPTPADAREGAGFVAVLDEGPRLFAVAPWAGDA